MDGVDDDIVAGPEAAAPNTSNHKRLRGKPLFSLFSASMLELWWTAAGKLKCPSCEQTAGRIDSLSALQRCRGPPAQASHKGKGAQLAVVGCLVSTARQRGGAPCSWPERRERGWRGVVQAVAAGKKAEWWEGRAFIWTHSISRATTLVHFYVTETPFCVNASRSCPCWSRMRKPWPCSLQVALITALPKPALADASSPRKVIHEEICTPASLQGWVLHLLQGTRRANAVNKPQRRTFESSGNSYTMVACSRPTPASDRQSTFLCFWRLRSRCRAANEHH